jgi:hypothetical protein
MNNFAKPIQNHPLANPSVWIMLADDALSAGRSEQAEELIEEAYSIYDEAISNAVICWLGSEEKTRG